MATLFYRYSFVFIFYYLEVYSRSETLCPFSFPTCILWYFYQYVCKYISLQSRWFSTLQILSFYSHICLDVIYGKGRNRGFLHLPYHWHIELYIQNCPLDSCLSFCKFLCKHMITLHFRFVNTIFQKTRNYFTFKTKEMNCVTIHLFSFNPYSSWSNILLR